MIDTVCRLGLSPVQEYFWQKQKLDPGGSAYNIASFFEISGALNPEFVRICLETLVSRHSMLRTTLSGGEEGAEQIILDDISVILQIKDYDRDELIKDIREPFSLVQGPLFRFILYRKKKLNYLLFLFHHIIIDLRSKDIFGEEFSLIYNSLIKQHQPVLAPTIPYETYIREFSSFKNTDQYGRMLSFWEDEDLPIAPLDLSPQGGEVERRSMGDSRISGALPADLFFDLHRYCEKEKTYPFLVLLSVYYLLLFKYSGRERICVGVPRTNRLESEYENVFGCFVNILPMVIDFSAPGTFRDLLWQVRQKMLLIHRNQFVPLVDLQKRLHADGDNAFFQVGFTNEYPMDLSLNGLTAEPLPIPGQGSQLDLYLHYWTRNGVYRWEMEYYPGLFSPEWARNFVDSFERILKRVIRDEAVLVTEYLELK